MKVFWSSTAKQNYLKTIDYLEDNWGDEVVAGFRKKVKKAVKTISKMPKSAIISEENEVRKFVVTKHNLIIYNILNEEVFIVAFVDARSDHHY